MNTTDRKPTKLTVTIIDTAKLSQRAFNALNKSRWAPDDQPTGCKTLYQHSFIETEQGIYALDSDGVGNKNPITEDKPYTIYFYAERVVPNKSGDGNSSWFATEPCMKSDWDGKDPEEMATTQKVNLADFIRQFGARLERSYEVWRQHLAFADDN